MLVSRLSIILMLTVTIPASAAPWAALSPSPNPRSYPIVVFNPDNRDYFSCMLFYIVNYQGPGGIIMQHQTNLHFSIRANTQNQIVGYFDPQLLPNSVMPNGPIVSCS